jgi:selenocysteine-specific elongation factor
METEILNVIIGTAGHVDHGKSALVKSITGIDPDRLPEEKQREMTIDLGFANFRLKDGRRVGIIDVPGHEDFIKNMVAGATSMDFIIFVVAANEGVKPQTVEHLDILKLLEVKNGVVVITKVDIVSKDEIEFVKEEIKELTKNTFLQDAPIIPVSAITGKGVDKLFEEINKRIIDVHPRNEEGVFRMPIQRVFSKKGYGTVITGVPLSGRLEIDQNIEILPIFKIARVKGLQAYFSHVPQIKAGHSSAVNVAGVEHTQIKRGFVAATPGYLKPAKFIEAKFKYLERLKKPLKNFTPIRLHVGTSEVLGRIVLLEKNELQPGEECIAQFRLESEVVVSHKDKFIVRLQSPLLTIGGGVILNTSNIKLKRKNQKTISYLNQKIKALRDNQSLVNFHLAESFTTIFDKKTLSLQVKLSLKEIEDVLSIITDEIVNFPSGKFTSIAGVENAKAFVLNKIEEFHKDYPAKAGIYFDSLLEQTKMEREHLQHIVERLCNDGKVIFEAERCRLADFEVKMDKETKIAYQRIEQIYLETGFSSPNLKELYQTLDNIPQNKINDALSILIQQGKIAMLEQNVILHINTLKKARDIVVNKIKKDGCIQTGEFRDMINSSRKFAVAILDHFDKEGLTLRKESTRYLKGG